jgi:hypothetical protein
MSILPIVDEFIVALGKSEDNTKEIIEDIDSEKIKIYEREWNEESFKEGKIFREETNFALSKCNGDWCFYLQADEIVHEKYLTLITKKCQEYLKLKKVEGFLLKYIHFWGDYDHYINSHAAPPKEIRIVRNNSGVYSYKDALSFRIKNDRKLKVVEIPAYVYHYGWVRPPALMISKKKEQDSMHVGKDKAEEKYKNVEGYFNYGPLGRLPKFKATHPEAMKNWIEKFDWRDRLNYGREYDLERELFKHEKLNYKILTFIENIFFGGEQLFGFKNYNKLNL